MELNWGLMFAGAIAVIFKDVIAKFFWSFVIFMTRNEFAIEGKRTVPDRFLLLNPNLGKFMECYITSYHWWGVTWGFYHGDGYIIKKTTWLDWAADKKLRFPMPVDPKTNKTAEVVSLFNRNIDIKKMMVSFALPLFFPCGCAGVLHEKEDPNSVMLTVWQQQKIAKMMDGFNSDDTCIPEPRKQLSCEELVYQFNTRCRIMVQDPISNEVIAAVQPKVKKPEKQKVKATKLHQYEEGDESVWDIQVEE